MLPLADHLTFHPAGSTYIAVIDTHVWPCILNRLVSFIKERLNTIQIMVLRQQYQMVAQDEEKDSFTETRRQGEM